MLEIARQDNLARLPWVVIALIPLFLAGMAHSWGSIAQAAPAQAQIHNAMGWIDLVMVGLLSAMTLIHFGASKLPFVIRLQVLMPVLGCWLFLLLGVVQSLMLQWTAATVTLYVLSCVFVASFLLIRPSQMVLPYLVSYILLFIGLGYTPVSRLIVNTGRLHGGIALLLGMGLSVMLWRRFAVTELLRQRVEAQRLELEASNTELAMQKEVLEKWAHRDALTGLLNRREFEAQADLALMRARRDGSGLAALMFDLDHFKKINDRYGHPIGDAAIRTMSDILRSSLRETDLVARVGGEEFMVLMPNSSALDAAEVAEKIRLRVLNTPIPVEHELPLIITVSAGVAEISAGHSASFEALYSATDQALYAAKHRGRNRVELGHITTFVVGSAPITQPSALAA